MIIKFITWQASAERDFYYDFYYNDVTKALDFQEHKNYQRHDHFQSNYPVGNQAPRIACNTGKCNTITMDAG